MKTPHAIRVLMIRRGRIPMLEGLQKSLATALSLRTGKPFNIIRKRKYGLPGEVPARVETPRGLVSCRLYFYKMTFRAKNMFS